MGEKNALLEHYHWLLNIIRISNFDLFSSLASFKGDCLYGTKCFNVWGVCVHIVSEKQESLTYNCLAVAQAFNAHLPG